MKRAGIPFGEYEVAKRPHTTEQDVDRMKRLAAYTNKRANDCQPACHRQTGYCTLAWDLTEDVRNALRYFPANIDEIPDDSMEEYVVQRVANIASTRDGMRLGLQAAFYDDYPLREEWKRMDKTHEQRVRKMIDDLDQLHTFLVDRPPTMTGWAIKVQNALDECYVPFVKDFEFIVDGIGDMLVKGFVSYDQQND